MCERRKMATHTHTSHIKGTGLARSPVNICLGGTPGCQIPKASTCDDRLATHVVPNGPLAHIARHDRLYLLHVSDTLESFLLLPGSPPACRQIAVAIMWMWTGRRLDRR